MKNLSLRLVPNFYSSPGNESNGIDSGKNIAKKGMYPTEGVTIKYYLFV